mmetsp:Transcript_32245/g.66733  ORF Transcript_32245/g.66733 Transcript_32245/m.66733 type:complete len:332 (+) Transcript_32245:77-1072(+)
MSLCSKSMLFSGASPRQARRMLVRHWRWANSALTTGVPGGTSGALRRYERTERTGWKRSKSASPCFFSEIRSKSSVRMTRSMMSGAASSESSHVLCITTVLVPPMKISDTYSSIARLLSPTFGTYLITTTWSGCSPGSYRMLLLATMSSTTFDLEISLDRNCCGSERFLPSLFPRWLYDTIDFTLIPAEIRKSTSTDFTLVCPDLKSSPPMNTFRSSASSNSPGTKVFCGDPLMYEAPSRTLATAKTVDGEISSSPRLIAARRFCALSFTPVWTSAKRSVLAVQSTMTLSSPFDALKSRISFWICSICSCLLPVRTLLALLDWFAAMKSGK